MDNCSNDVQYIYYTHLLPTKGSLDRDLLPRALPKPFCLGFRVSLALNSSVATTEVWDLMKCSAGPGPETYTPNMRVLMGILGFHIRGFRV